MTQTQSTLFIADRSAVGYNAQERRIRAKESAISILQDGFNNLKDKEKFFNELFKKRVFRHPTKKGYVVLL